MSVETPDALDALAERTLQLAVVARALDERSEQAARSTERAALDVAAAAAHLSGLGERIAREATRAIATEAASQARVAASDAFVEARAALEAHASRVQELDRALASSRHALARMQRRWMVLVPSALIVGSALAVAGATAWVAKARSDVARLQADAATLQTLAAADVVRCGTSLCARTAPGHADADGYRRIAQRPALR